MLKKTQKSNVWLLRKNLQKPKVLETQKNLKKDINWMFNFFLENDFKMPANPANLIKISVKSEKTTNILTLFSPN